jgi:hypothetical protein
MSWDVSGEESRAMTTPRSDQSPAPIPSPYGAITPAASSATAGGPDATLWAVRAATAVLALGGLAMMLAGFVFVGADLEDRGEMFDGLGVVIGLVICALAGILLGVAVFAVWLVRRRPMAGAVLVCVFGLLVTLIGWFVVSGGGLLVAAPTLLGGLVVAGLGFGGAVAARR